jgi:hypothetical protein
MDCQKAKRGQNMRNTALILMVLLVSVAGCSFLYDLWPAQIPKDVQTYSGIEPNDIGWPGIGKLKELREHCITKNIIIQSNLAQQMTLDKALYGRAIEQANINIQQAEEERAQIVGTIQNPGWLLSFLLPTVGALAGRSLTQLTHYSEAELQQKLSERASSATEKT